MTKFLNVSDLSVKIEGKEIVSNVSFNAEKGENISILGPNGAGKTTLLKGVSNLIAHSGNVTINFENTETMSSAQRAANICYVPQNSNIGSSFNVKSFVELARYPYRMPWQKWTAQDRKMVEKALELTKCGVFADRDITTLSGGERQRVFIAAAIAQNSPVILFDEPVTFLDPVNRSMISNIIDSLSKNEDRLVINVTHEVNEALLYSTRIIVFDQGKIVFDGTPEEIIRKKVLNSVFKTEFVETIHPVLNKSLLFPGRGEL